MFVASTGEAQIISAAGDTLSVPAPTVQHEDAVKADKDEGKPTSVTSGSCNYSCVML